MAAATEQTSDAGELLPMSQIPAPALGPKQPKWRWILVGSIATVLLLGVVLIVDSVLSRSQLHDFSISPEGVHEARYQLGVVGHTTGLLHRQLPDQLWVIRVNDDGKPWRNTDVMGSWRADHRGYHVNDDAVSGSRVELQSVQWRAAGVSIKFESGQRLFISAHHYLGGRVSHG